MNYRRLTWATMIALSTLTVATADAADSWAKGNDLILDGYEITNVTTELVLFNSLRQFRRYVDNHQLCGKKGQYCDIASLEGLSACTRNVIKNTAHCTIWQTRPRKVDDEAMLTLGHELAHGIYGGFHE